MARKTEELKKPAGAPMSKLEQLVRDSGLEVDKPDVARLRAFVYQKVYDLLLAATVQARANNRQLFEPSDLPITRGLQLLINDFKMLHTAINLGPLLEKLSKLPPLDLGSSASTEALLPDIIGALTLGLARAFKIIDPEMKKPAEVDWQKVEQIFDLLL